MKPSAIVVLWLCWISSGAALAGDSGHPPHFIVIGVDGLSVDAVISSKSPRLHDLMSRSAWSLEARGVMPTLSSPNWESMITGAGPEQHGITSNGHLRRMVELQPVCRNAEGMFPTMFEALRAQRPSSLIAVFHDWPGFADLLEKHALDVLRHEHGAARTTEAAVQYWKDNRPELMFVHLDNVDQAGHDQGWSSRDYYHAVEEADGFVGRILDMLEDVSAWDSTYVLVTSDHGGKGSGHGKNSLPEIEIPWILSGPGVVRGRLATSVYTFDTAATIAWIFGIRLSECSIGRPVMAAFQPSGIQSQNNSQDQSQGRGCGDGRLIPTVILGAGDLKHREGMTGNEPKN